MTVLVVAGTGSAVFRDYFDRDLASREQGVTRGKMLLGHAPRGYKDFAAEIATRWRNE